MLTLFFHPAIVYESVQSRSIEFNAKALARATYAFRSSILLAGRQLKIGSYAGETERAGQGMPSGLSAERVVTGPGPSLALSSLSSLSRPSANRGWYAESARLALSHACTPTTHRLRSVGLSDLDGRTRRPTRAGSSLIIIICSWGSIIVFRIIIIRHVYVCVWTFSLFFWLPGCKFQYCSGLCSLLHYLYIYG